VLGARFERSKLEKASGSRFRRPGDRHRVIEGSSQSYSPQPQLPLDVGPLLQYRTFAIVRPASYDRTRVDHQSSQRQLTARWQYAVSHETAIRS
jgi:hypothetical protein